MSDAERKDADDPEDARPDDGDEPMELELEEEAPPPEERASCPDCGAPLRGAAVCLRCGEAPREDAKVGAGAAGAGEPSDRSSAADDGDGDGDDADDEDHWPLVGTHRTDPWLPIGIAAIATLTLVVGALAGARGLFPALPEGTAGDPTSWPLRIDAVGKLPVAIVVWTLCGMIALGVIAWIEERPIGHIGRAAMRMLAAVAAARTVALVALPWPFVETTVEWIGSAAVFALATLLLFRVRPRGALIVTGATIAAFAGVYVLALLVTWAM